MKSLYQEGDKSHFSYFTGEEKTLACVKPQLESQFVQRWLHIEMYLIGILALVSPQYVL